jgi:hypothetical protein
MIGTGAFPGLMANELFCMTLAKAVWLNVPVVETRWVDKYRMHQCTKI